MKRRTIDVVIVACAVVVALVLLLWLPGYIREYNAVSDFLLWVKDRVNRELAARGACDLERLKTEIAQKAHAPALMWTGVDVVSESTRYEGCIVCCFPERYFGKLRRSRWGLAIVRDDTQKGKANRVIADKFIGAPDFIREKQRPRVSDAQRRECPVSASELWRGRA